MPPAYNSQAYWNDRFAREPHFDWLLPPSTVLPIIAQHLNPLRTGSKRIEQTNILHIGCGNSDLSYRLPSLLSNSNNDAVTNVDFSPTAIEAAKGKDCRSASCWLAVDLLAVDDVLAKLHHPDSDPFTFVLDKSTSDSIACGDDVSIALPYPLQPTHTQPSNNSAPPSPPSSPRTAKVHPLHLLALHLALLCPTQGSKWLVLSFSEQRFPFLEDDRAPFEGLPEGPLSPDVVRAGLPDTQALWRMEGKWAMNVSRTDSEGDVAHGRGGGAERQEGKEGGVVYKPPEVCWVYILVRTHVGVEVSR